jgi:hypothetical protein
MLNRRRAAALAGLMFVAAGCGVNGDNIEHWKHTQRGPRKIMTVLVGTNYPQPLRVHAARALVEMKHPNANGLDVLALAMQQMPVSEREGIVHALLPELQRMMAPAAAPAPGAAAAAPTEPQIKAKDAAYVLLRGDGRSSFASADDRAALANLILDWVLADFNQRALAGSYTAEQIVNAVGPTAADRLTRALTSDDNAIPVSVEIARLINTVGAPAGKQAAVAQLVRNATEVGGAGATERMRAKARSLLTTGGRAVDDARVNAAAEQLRGQYLTVLFEAIKTLGQPNGTEYLLTVASDPAVTIERRRSALTAMSGSVSAANNVALLAIINACPAGAPVGGAQCDVDLRGLAVDRIGETRTREVIPTLFSLFDQANGVAADMSFTIRWKLGEAILRLGGASVLPEFMTHLAAPRSAPFAGFTFAEISGEAQAIGDISPPPRDALRGFTAASYAQPVRLLAMMFLGIKGETQDLALLQSFAADATPVAGEGWSAAQLTTVGAVAARSKDNLQQALRAAQQAPANGATAQP